MLAELAEKLMSNLDMPEGYTIYPFEPEDGKHLAVRGNKYCFLVTEKYRNEHTFEQLVEYLKLAIPDLVKWDNGPDLHQAWPTPKVAESGHQF